MTTRVARMHRLGTLPTLLLGLLVVAGPQVRAEMCMAAAAPFQNTCDCGTTETVTVAKNNADIVFAGTVEEITDGVVIRTVRVKAQRFWKGEVVRTVIVQTPVFDCGYPFTVGQTYLIYAVEGLNPDTWTTNVCMRTKTLATAENDVRQLGNPTVVAREDEAPLVDRPTLRSFPNPFAEQTQIEYALPQAADVTLEVYDALGRRVARLVEGTRPAGTHRAGFNGARMPQGLYVAMLRVGDEVVRRRLLLVR